jgi:hypothetical protein
VTPDGPLAVEAPFRLSNTIISLCPNRDSRHSIHLTLSARLETILRRIDPALPTYAVCLLRLRYPALKQRTTCVAAKRVSPG